MGLFKNIKTMVTAEDPYGEDFGVEKAEVIESLPRATLLTMHRQTVSLNSRL